MDSEHRHELKTNELADLLTHFPQFIKKNANTIIGIALILIAVITWPLFSKMGREKSIAEQSQVAQSIQLLNMDIRKALGDYQNAPTMLDLELDTILVNADALMEITNQTDNPNLAAMAYIKAAQAIRTELHLKKEVVNAELVDTQTQKAQEAYEKAEDLAVMPTMKAMAKFGLGLCAEERGQTQQATDIYTEIVNNESFAATIFPKQAQLRLDALSDNAESFTFVQATEPVVEENLAPPMEAEAAPVVQDSPAAVTDTPETTDMETAPENAEN